MSVARKHHTLLIVFISLMLLTSSARHLSAETSENLYLNAYKSYKSLEGSGYKDRWRWINCINLFESVYRNNVDSSRADDALFIVGKIYTKLYQSFHKKTDIVLAIEYYRRLTEHYPRSNLADDAQYQIAEIFLKLKHDPRQAYDEYTKVVSNFPSGDMRKRAERMLGQLTQDRPKPSVSQNRKPCGKKGVRLARVFGIRHWSSPHYTRVVIDIDKKVSFSKHLLKEDSEFNKPRRLYIDLKDTRIDPSITSVPIHDDLLSQARVAQHTPDIVRVVLDIKTIQDFKVFSLNDPFRIIIDVTEKTSRRAEPKKKKDLHRTAIAKRLEWDIKRIIIDPGHGGKHPGAVGINGLKEKDVVLKIAKKLKGKIIQRLSCEVFLTRNDDTSLPLEERTAIANTKKADLFISIHTNAHKNRNLCGIQTYYLNLTTDKEALELAARENATSAQNISDLQVILRDLILNSMIIKSSGLAEYIQECMVYGLRRNHKGINDLGVKQAPFIVLMGAKMPSVLVEVSFISNKKEVKRLTNDKYLNDIACGIADGVMGYITQLKTASLRGL